MGRATPEQMGEATRAIAKVLRDSQMTAMQGLTLLFQTSGYVAINSHMGCDEYVALAKQCFGETRHLMASIRDRQAQRAEGRDGLGSGLS